jgi:hypothetical protein
MGVIYSLLENQYVGAALRKANVQPDKRAGIEKRTRDE